MKIGVAVFAYCRNKHLEQVLEGLKCNRGIDKLYIFQDGLKKEEHRAGWVETTNVIEAIDWCEVKYIKAAENLGLRSSIIRGVSYVLEENDAIIVLEDDCVPTPGFMTYMRACLQKYELDQNIWHVSAYTPPFLNEKKDDELYFLGRMLCWGWGTWKNRWSKCDFEKDYLTLLQTDKELSLKTNLWSALDFENVLCGVQKGVIDTWDTWWALCILEYNGLCVNPYMSYVRNIGFDGSGCNCNERDTRFDSMLQMKNIEEISFPMRNSIPISVVSAFSHSFLGSSLAYHELFDADRKAKKAIVYGVGNGLRQYENEISESYKVIAFVDKNRCGYYAGLDIIRPDKIREYLTSDEKMEVLITILDVTTATEIKKYLMDEYEIDEKQIVVLSQVFHGTKNL